MAFQFSHEFHRNWLAAPSHTRNQIKADLAAIVDLLNPETGLSAWQKKQGIFTKRTESAEQVGLFDSDQNDAQADTNYAGSFSQKTFTQALSQSEIFNESVNNFLSSEVSENRQPASESQHENIQDNNDTSKFLQRVRGNLTTDESISASSAASDVDSNLNFSAANSLTAEKSMLANELNAKIDEYLESAVARFRKELKQEVFAWLSEKNIDI